LETKDYRLTIVQAGTGYGKSTALAALAKEEAYPVVWYRLDAEDADPLLFLLHLLSGFSITLPDFSEAPLALLEDWERSSGDPPWATVVDVLINELVSYLNGPVFLVLDDVHHIANSVEPLRTLNRLIGRAPDDLHPILATRYPLKLPSLIDWRVRGQVLEIGQEELAFTSEEIAALFGDTYGLALTSDQVTELADRVEGWPIALQLVWQRLQSGKGSSLNQALGQLSGSTGDLFAFLAQEVLAQQPADIQEFLRSTAVLRQMTADICNCLRQANDSDQLLRYLLENDLFVVNLGDGHVRYHHLFRDLLSQQSSRQLFRTTHLRAAHCCRQQGQEEEALYHLLRAEAFDEAAGLLDDLGRELVRAGRLDSLGGWIEALPPEVLADHPPLLAYLGDIARLHSRFDEALGWYQQAEERSRAKGNLRAVGQALRGQARVYLDTVDASRAEELLQEALRLSDGQEDRQSRARLLDLLAENLVNRGRLEEAEDLQSQARALREEGPAEAELSVRLLLRTGRLDRARQVLEERAEAERQEPVLRPRAHRETLLLLSLVLAFQGEQEASFRCAEEATERGRVLHSNFITAVGHMRQGHAWMLLKNEQGFQEATRCFQEAITLSERLEVPRLKVEADWGLCQIFGFGQDLETAREVAVQGIELAQEFGDEWVEACIGAVMGASYALAGHLEEASAWLSGANTAYRECGDIYGEAVVRLWQCLIWHAQGDMTRLERDVTDLLRLVQTHGYDYLFHRKTLMGPPDPRSLVPLLLYARKHTRYGTTAENILAHLGLSSVELHPGFQLRVQMLGPFHVWRGTGEITRSQWRRKKARQLFQLLITYRGAMLERDQIVEMLWPEMEPEGAQRDFKIALSALYAVLEPARTRNAPSAFVARDGTCYGLRPQADLWLDVDDFARLIDRGDEAYAGDPEASSQYYRQALALYQGEYLQEYPYEEWCSEERERLLTLYLRTAERVAAAYVDQSAWEEALEVCRLILVRDNCWEQAYRLMMMAYAGQGNQAHALRTYRRCLDCLQAELGVEPAPTTRDLYETIRQTKSN
jgi:ATP/maltotriose-dependent transcriptional regulator MalT/DNA-binding SARP family transcriptional activator